MTLHQNIIHWLETNQLLCPVKNYLHIPCPGCGFQTSFIALLKGDIISSFQYHPVTIPLLLFFLFALLQLIFRFRYGNKIIVYSYLFIAVLLLTNYIYKTILYSLA